MATLAGNVMASKAYKLFTMSRMTRGIIDKQYSVAVKSEMSWKISNSQHKSTSLKSERKPKEDDRLPKVESKEIPRITIPRAIEDILYKKKMRLIEKNAKTNTKFLGPARIHCKRKEFNHYRDQKYTNFGQQYLASAYWKKSKYNGDYFTIIPCAKNPALIEKNESDVTFESTGLRPDICRVLSDYEIKRPTNIQIKAIPTLLTGGNVMCSAETGSGKTLAFLLPMVQRVLKMRDHYSGSSDNINRPLGIILVPTHELADQTYEVARDLAEPLNLQVRSLVGRFSKQTLAKNKPEAMDILIVTPGILSKAIVRQVIDVNRASMIVFDEADTLMDDSFIFIIQRLLRRLTIRTSAALKYPNSNNSNSLESDVSRTPLENDNADIERSIDSSQSDEQILDSLERHLSSLEAHRASEQNASSNTDVLDNKEDGLYAEPMLTNMLQDGVVQFCMVGATIPRTVKEMFGSVVPEDSVSVVQTDEIFRILPHVTQRFVRVSSSTKTELLIQQVKKNVGDQKPTIIFCNKGPTVSYLATVLRDCGVHSMSVLTKIDPNRAGAFDDWHIGRTEILLTTDLASRGLDTTRASMVINYDFPSQLVDYVHRAGRVGRVGGAANCVVLSYVQHKWDVELLWRIETAVRQNAALQGVVTNVKRYHEERHKAKQQNRIQLNV